MRKKIEKNKIPLKADFKYTHHPLEKKDIEGFFWGREDVIEELETYIEKSARGSILVTGYRGVGKTSLVNNVINKLNSKNETEKREWDLYMMSATDELSKQEKIDKFKAEPEKSKRTVLIVNVETDTRKVWAIAMFNDEGEFVNKDLADDKNNELAIELNKVANEKDRIIKLATSYIGLAQKRQKYFKITINVADEIDPKLLMYQIIRQIKQSMEEEFPTLKEKEFDYITKTRSPDEPRNKIGNDGGNNDFDCVYKDICDKYLKTVGNMVVESNKKSGNSVNIGVDLFGAFKSMFNTSDEHAGKVIFNSFVYDYHSAQEDIKSIIKEIQKIHRFIFVFDELDKLKVSDVNNEETKRARKIEFEKTVSMLKPLFTETDAVFIFVAGRDVDDNWVEDQNKGDGLYESIFAQNIYVSSFLHDKNDKNSLTKQTKGLVENLITEKLLSQDCKEEDYEWKKDTVLENLFSEFCNYLTFKGRGIPRKILGEISKFVKWEEDSESILYGRPILSFSDNNKKRIKFYSNILKLIENNLEHFKDSDDRSKVSLFYIIDYILKFYESGFNWKDIEKASILSEEGDLFVPIDIVQKVLTTILEGVYIERVYGSKHNYKFTPKIEVEIRTLAQLLDEEQIEFRFTHNDFDKAISYFSMLDDRSETTEPSQRTISIRAQMELGDIYFKLNNYSKATLYYKKAVRFGLDEISKYIPLGNLVPPIISSNINILINLIAQTYNAIGNIHEKQMEYDIAISCYSQSLYAQMRSWEHLKDLNEKQSFLEKMPGAIIERHPTLPPVLNDNNKSIIIENIIHNAELSNTLNHIACVMEKCGERKTAKLYLDFNCEVMMADMDYKSLAVQLNMIGDIFFMRGDIDNAKEYYTSVCDLYEKHKEIPPLVMAHNYNDLGNVLFVMAYDKKHLKDNVNEALENYNNARQRYLTAKYHNAIVSILSKCGKLEHLTGRQEKDAHCRKLVNKDEGQKIISTELSNANLDNAGQQSTKNPEDTHFKKGLDYYMTALRLCRERYIDRKSGKDMMRFIDERNYAVCMLEIGNMCLHEIKNDSNDKYIKLTNNVFDIIKQLIDEFVVYTKNIAVIDDGIINNGFFKDQDSLRNYYNYISEKNRNIRKNENLSIEKDKFYIVIENSLLIAGRSLMRHAHSVDNAWIARRLGLLYYKYYKDKGINIDAISNLIVLERSIKFHKIAVGLYTSDITENAFAHWIFADNCYTFSQVYYELSMHLNKIKSEDIDEVLGKFQTYTLANMLGKSQDELLNCNEMNGKDLLVSKIKERNFKIMCKTDNTCKQTKIDEFKAEPEKNKHTVLIVYVDTVEPKVLTIARFNDEGEFAIKELVVDGNNKLVIELNKKECKEDRIIELAIPYLVLIQMKEKIEKRIDKLPYYENQSKKYMRNALEQYLCEAQYIFNEINEINDKFFARNDFSNSEDHRNLMMRYRVNMSRHNMELQRTKELKNDDKRNYLKGSKYLNDIISGLTEKIIYYESKNENILELTDWLIRKKLIPTHL